MQGKSAETFDCDSSTGRMKKKLITGQRLITRNPDEHVENVLTLGAGPCLLERINSKD
jgi:hypothetical protein